jgi:tRNA pseudouridine38-40 synthase
MAHFKITIAYDGAAFVGWQRQAAGASIQGLLEDALATLDKRPVTVSGAGRTDAGVHALGQVAAFELRRPDIDAPTIVRALNAALPPAVRVLSAAEAPADFHPRFDARAKTYRYRIWNREVLLPFERGRVWHIPLPLLDVDAMARAAVRLEGRHDFAAFQASGAATHTTERVVHRSCVRTEAAGPLHGRRNDGVPPPSTSTAQRPSREIDCEVSAVSAVPSRFSDADAPVVCDDEYPVIAYEIRGDGFLRHMVRNIVGTLVDIGRHRHPVEWLDDVVASADRTQAGRTAPADGLFLVRVEYDAQL